MFTSIKNFAKNRFRSFLGVKEQEFDGEPIFGTPVSYQELNFWNGRSLQPIWQAEQYQDKLQTIRTIQLLNRARHLSRYMYEISPNAQGAINGLNRYVIGKGAEVAIQSTTGSKEPPKQLKEETSEFIDQLKKAWNFKALVKEVYHRYLKDGEVFIELELREDGITMAYFIEPDAIIPPYNESWDGRWSWGIDTGPDLEKTSVPLAYNVRNLRASTERQVPAQFILHLKRAANLNQKRGIPALYSCQEDVTGSKKLRGAQTQGESVRSSIAYVREWALAPEAAITGLQQINATGSYTQYNQNGSTSTVVTQQVTPGTVQDIPEGMQMKSGPTSSSSEAVVSTIKLNLEAVAAALEVPYWLVSGDNNSSSYASSLTTESPFMRLVESDQEMVGDYVDDLITRSVEIATEQGVLQENTLEKIDLHINFKSPIMRNLKEETDRNKVLHDAGQLSAESWSAVEGRDYEKEQANLEKERALQPVVLPAGETELEQAPKTTSGQMQREMGSVA